MCVEQGEGEGKREEGEGDGEKDDAPVKCWSRCQDRLSLVPEPPDEAKETGRKEGRRREAIRVAVCQPSFVSGRPEVGSTVIVRQI